MISKSVILLEYKLEFSYGLSSLSVNLLLLKDFLIDSTEEIKVLIDLSIF